MTEMRRSRRTVQIAARHPGTKSHVSKRTNAVAPRRRPTPNHASGRRATRTAVNRNATREAKKVVVTSGSRAPSTTGESKRPERGHRRPARSEHGTTKDVGRDRQQQDEERLQDEHRVGVRPAGEDERPGKKDGITGLAPELRERPRAGRR